MKEEIITKINEAKQLLEDQEDHECKLRQYKIKNNLDWSVIDDTGIRKEICSRCLLGQAIDTYDIYGNIVKINICTLLDVMDYIEC